MGYEGQGFVENTSADGWELVSIKGRHHKIRKNGQTEIIPVHGKDVKIGLLVSILKRTGLEVKK